MTSLPSTHDAEAMIESLRKGIPPERFASEYSSGNDEFLENVRTRHLEGNNYSGKIRFVNGSWGSGKTHFLRLLREQAFEVGYLVSFVELANDETPFDKFEKVFHGIVRKITSPAMYQNNYLFHSSPFGEVLKEALFGEIASEDKLVPNGLWQERHDELMQAEGIDVDFKRVIDQYWATFTEQSDDRSTLQERRATLLQWFSGEGRIGSFRKEFGVSKMVNRQNSRLMLQSLSSFSRLIGFKGLLILFDEAERTYSTMRSSDLKQAQNNLLHLINTTEDTAGLFLIYATTPDFFTDDKFGIRVYGALAQRIGQPENRPPRALDRVWNLDAVEHSNHDYAQVACKIRDIYLQAYPEANVLTEDELREYVVRLGEHHPRYSMMGKWRMVVTATVNVMDAYLEGYEPPTPELLHDEIVARSRP